MNGAIRAALLRTHLTRKISEEPTAQAAYGRLFLLQMKDAERRAAELRVAAIAIESPDFETEQ
jgi:hypothetical protein